MSTILLRTLTRKSKLGFWNFTRAHDTVQVLIDRNKHQDLIAAYYKLNKINFLDDILDELKITSEWRIEKPGTDIDIYYAFLEQSDYKMPPKYKADILKYQHKYFTSDKAPLTIQKFKK
jgi:Leucine-rich repeat (LRR) protein